MKSRRNERIKKVSESDNRQRVISTLILLMLGGASLAGIYYYLYSQQSAQPGFINNAGKQPGACQRFFHTKVYHSVQRAAFNTTLIGELHGQYEEHVADCLEMLAKDGDHLLIEMPNQNKEIACDSIHPAYKRFNHKLRCYGFDVGVDDARRLYADHAYRANFIAEKMAKFLEGAISANEVRKNLKSFADFTRDQNGPNNEITSFNNRFGKYLARLAKRMDGLNIKEMHDFLFVENKFSYEKAKQYELLSRQEPTNSALVQKMKEHQNELTGSQQNLFAVAGANHFDMTYNKNLKEEIEKMPGTVTILTPK